MQRQPITNFLLVTRESAVFMKLVDSSNHMAEGGRKNALYLAEQIGIVFRELGAETVTVLFRSLWMEQLKHAGPSLMLRFSILFVLGALLMLWICFLKT